MISKKKTLSWCVKANPRPAGIIKTQTLLSSAGTRGGRRLERFGAEHGGRRVAGKAGEFCSTLLSAPKLLVGKGMPQLAAIQEDAADGDEAWEARGWPREREKPRAEPSPPRSGSVPMVYPGTAADFHAKISNLRIKTEFLRGLAAVRVVFKMQGAALPVKPRPELFSHQAHSSSRTSWIHEIY